MYNRASVATEESTRVSIQSQSKRGSSGKSIARSHQRCLRLGDTRVQPRNLGVLEMEDGG
jgi:hypothetical protein